MALSAKMVPKLTGHLKRLKKTIENLRDEIYPIFSLKWTFTFRLLCNSVGKLFWYYLSLKPTVDSERAETSTLHSLILFVRLTSEKWSILLLTHRRNPWIIQPDLKNNSNVYLFYPNENNQYIRLFIHSNTVYRGRWHTLVCDHLIS